VAVITFAVSFVIVLTVTIVPTVTSSCVVQRVLVPVIAVVIVIYTYTSCMLTDALSYYIDYCTLKLHHTI